MVDAGSVGADQSEAGAVDCLLKDASLDEIVEAVMRAAGAPARTSGT